jgi:hypothetical protein
LRGGDDQPARIVTDAPLWLSNYGRVIDTEETVYELTYESLTGHYRTLWVNNEQISDARKFIELCKHDAPVTSLNLRSVLAYLNHYKASIARGKQKKYVGSRTGLYKVNGEYGWLIGSQWLGSGELIADPSRNSRYNAALTPTGDLGAWLWQWRAVRNENWLTRFIVGASFAAPLIRLLGSRTFIVHHFGESSGGKTALARFALSVWGNPDTLYSSMNRTNISITEIFRHINDLPVLYDEKQVSTVDGAQFIYSVCAGSGRERANKGGGLSESKQTWNTIALTTGEVPLVSANDVGGQFNRVLQVHTRAFAKKVDAEQLYLFTPKHHGLAGPEFLRRLLPYAQDVLKNGEGSVLHQAYEKMRRELSTKVNLDANHCGYAAIVAMGQYLADVLLLEVDQNAAWQDALEGALEALGETAPSTQLSYAERALTTLRDHFVANPVLYQDHITEEGKAKAGRSMRIIGIRTVFGMAYLPTEVNRVLRSGTFDPDRVWHDFRRLGWLTSSGETPFTSFDLHHSASYGHQVLLVKSEVLFGDQVKASHLRLVRGVE